MDIKKYDYLIANVQWSSGFKHKIAMRGFQLKSEIDFHKSLSHVTSFTWDIVTEEEYEKHKYGELECQSSVPAVTKSKTTKTRASSRSKAKTVTKEATIKQSRTKQSAKPVTKNTKPKGSSSKKEKISNGSQTRSGK